jgi:hypothetical protein
MLQVWGHKVAAANPNVAMALPTNNVPSLPSAAVPAAVPSPFAHAHRHRLSACAVHTSPSGDIDAPLRA